MHFTDLKDKPQIIRDICKILKQSWFDIKLQLIIVMGSVFGNCCWYSSLSLVKDIYYLYFIDPQEEVELEFRKFIFY